MSDTSEKLWATHGPCGHTWIVAHLPMELGKAARMMRDAHCPKCGEKREIYMAKKEDIEAAIQAVEVAT